MKRIVVIVLMTAACLGNAQAQLHLKANVQNNHLWRGMEVSDGIVLLTDLSYTMVNDHVTVGLWGGCNSEGSYKEFNHYLNLKAGGWGFALWDTYNFSPGATYNNKEYWNYSAHTTGPIPRCYIKLPVSGREVSTAPELVNGSLRTRPQQRQYRAEIFHLRLCGIPYLPEGWLEG